MTLPSFCARQFVKFSFSGIFFHFLVWGFERCGNIANGPMPFLSTKKRNEERKEGFLFVPATVGYKKKSSSPLCNQFGGCYIRKTAQ